MRQDHVKILQKEIKLKNDYEILCRTSISKENIFVMIFKYFTANISTTALVTIKTISRSMPYFNMSNFRISKCK